MTSEFLLQNFSLKYLGMFNISENLQKLNVEFLCNIYYHTTLILPGTT